MEKKTKKIVWFIVRLAVAAALITAAFYINWEDITKVLSEPFDWKYIFLGFSLTLVIIFIGVVRWRMLLSTQGAKVPMLQILRLNFIGYFFNLFIPGATGGDVMKAYYIATIFPEKKAEVAMTVFLDRFLGLYGLFLVAGIALAVNFNVLWANPDLRIIIIILAALIVGGLVFWILALSPAVKNSNTLRRIGAKIPGHRLIGRIYIAVYAYRNRPGQVILAVVISMFAHIFNILGNFFFAKALGMNVDVTTFFFIVAIGLFINAIPIAPMCGLGVGEMAYMKLFELAGFGVYKGKAVLIAVFMHLTFMIWSLFGTVFYLQGRERIAQAVAAAEADAGKDSFPQETL
jgi:hypothetical protein